MADPSVTELLKSPYGWALAGVFGGLWGSFANVCIHRIPEGQSISRPPSHCPSCKTPIAWHDNIPVFGWLILGGRCRKCRARIPPRYLAVELLAILLSLLVYARFVTYVGPWASLASEGGPPGVALSRYIVYFFFSVVLLVLSAIDVRHRILPDRITYPAIPLFFLLGRLLYFQSPGTPASGVSFWQAALGMGVGYLIVRAISDGYYYLTGREGLGYGDGKLLSLIGALFGFSALPFTLLIASLLGLFIGAPIALILRRRQAEDDGTALRHTQVVFGPFLALAAGVYLLFLLGRDLDSLLLLLLGPLFGETV